MSNIATTVQSNVITLSRSNFTVPQRRVLFAIIETLSPYLRGNLGFTHGKEISYQTALDNIGKITYKASDLSRAENYGELRTALLQLEDKKYFIETEDFELRTRLILQSKFLKRTEYIELIINTELFDILLDVSKGYTLYQTKVALSFSSIYAMKLYEVLAKWRAVPKFYISIDELRRLTDTHVKYTKANDLKKNVLDLAKEQLDQSDITDLRFRYREKKQGKRIIGFDITVIKTDKSHEYEKQITTNAPSLRWDFKKTLIENFDFYGIVVKGETEKIIKAYKANFGERRLAEDLERFAEQAKNNNARSVPGYIMSCFKNEMNPSARPNAVHQNSEKEPWEMNEEERLAYVMKKRAVSDAGPQMLGDLFNNTKKK
jgi:plasmid replication initiation protein